MAKFEGRGACACCKSPVDVYADKNGLAYYKCGPCGIKLTHSKPQKSAQFVGMIDRHADEDAAPAPAGQVPAAVLEKTGNLPAKKHGLFGFGS